MPHQRVWSSHVANAYPFYIVNILVDQTVIWKQVDCTCHILVNVINVEEEEQRTQDCSLWYS